MGFLAVLLALGAIVVLLAGFNYLSQATLGVGLVGTAGVLGILARMAQAAAYQRQQMDLLSAINEQLAGEPEPIEEYEESDAKA